LDVKTILERIDEVMSEHNMPKRVKATLEDIKRNLANDKEDLAVRATTAIYAIDELSNDVNIPMHMKTVLWDITGLLETLKGD